MLYHGGCHNCKHVKDVFPCYCKQCCYYEPDWRLPDLNDSHYSTEIGSLIYGGLEGLHEYLNRKNMKNKIIIEGKEFELPDELVNKIKEELNKPKKLDYNWIYNELISQSISPEKYDTLCPSYAHSRKLEAINKLMNVAKYLNGDWKIDFNDESKVKWYMRISREKTVDTSTVYGINVSFVYFKTGELAQQAIDILGEDTIKLALSTDW